MIMAVDNNISNKGQHSDWWHTHTHTHTHD